MKLFDITIRWTEDMVTWPSDFPPQIKRIHSIDEGEDSNVTQVTASVHLGTHVDAPDHFLNNGKMVEDIPLELMVGPAVVAAVTGEKAITAQDLRNSGIHGQHKRVLLKTDNSRFWQSNVDTFQENFLALTGNAADYLVECGIEVIGIDYLSIAPFTDPVPAHEALLQAGVLIIETLDLSGIEPGEYTLLCLPLKIAGSEGAPARVLLQAPAD